MEPWVGLLLMLVAIVLLGALVVVAGVFVSGRGRTPSAEELDPEAFEAHR